MNFGTLQLSGKWSEMIGPEGMVINVADWNARATLEVIGESKHVRPSHKPVPR